LPAGTEVYIDGLGWRTVEDNGSGIGGKTIDVFVDDHSYALQLGIRYAEVFIYKEVT
jgi:3D (Asp-Asp-Asp) domain-containing protein